MGSEKLKKWRYIDDLVQLERDSNRGHAMTLTSLRASK